MATRLGSTDMVDAAKGHQPSSRLHSHAKSDKINTTFYN